MSMSDALEAQLLDYVLKNTAVSFTPGTPHLALFAADPTDANVTANEISTAVATDTAYARQTIVFDAATSGAGSTESNTAQTFLAVVGAGYTCTHFGIYDALTAGTLLHHGQLATPIIRNTGQALTFVAGNIKVIYG